MLTMWFSPQKQSMEGGDRNRNEFLKICQYHWNKELFLSIQFHYYSLLCPKPNLREKIVDEYEFVYTSLIYVSL